MKPKLNEATLNKADVKAILQTASELRGEGRGGVKRFFGLGKDKVDVADLQKVWANGLDPKGNDRYSLDTDNIKRILKKFGFGNDEINKVFARVLKTDNSDTYHDVADAPARSKGVQQIADFIKKHGLQQEMIEYLEQEYGDELGIKESINFDEIYQIFREIVKEERADRIRLLREEEKFLLGRTRK
jgi:hypothetical protein